MRNLTNTGTTHNATLIDICYSQVATDQLSGSASSTSPLQGRKTRTSQRSRPAALDQLDRWLLEPAETPRTLPDDIAYWRVKRGSYPQLANMALDILSIPPTSCEAERIFSRYFMSPLPPPSHCCALSLTCAPSAKLLVNDRRASLKEDMIEASECLKHWQNEGLV
jgi:hypothetical protein